MFRTIGGFPFQGDTIGSQGFSSSGRGGGGKHYNPKTLAKKQLIEKVMEKRAGKGDDHAPLIDMKYILEDVLHRDKSEVSCHKIKIKIRHHNR